MVRIDRRTTVTTLCVVLAIAGLMLLNAHSRAATGGITQFYTVKAENPPAAVASGAPRYVNRTVYKFWAKWNSYGCVANLTNTWISGPYHGTSEFAGAVAVPGVFNLISSRYEATSGGNFDSWSYTYGSYNGDLCLSDASTGATIVELATSSCGISQ